MTVITGAHRKAADAALPVFDWIRLAGPQADAPTSGDDHIDGTAGDDVIDGVGGNDVINGLGGHDTLDGGAGDDAIDGGADDDDLLVSGTGADIVHGGSGDDTLFIDYRDATSKVFSPSDPATAPGTDGFTDVIATQSGDRIVSYDGIERVQVRSGSANDVIHMNDVQSDIRAGDGDDEVLTGANADFLDGEAGNDWLRGGDGNDVVSGGFGNDRLEGGTGDDEVLDMGGADDLIYGGDGNDLLSYLSDLEGGVANALLDGGTGNDQINYTAYGYDDLATLVGGDGNDRFSTYGGAHIIIDAGAGADRLFLANVGTAYDITLGAGSDMLSLSGYSFASEDGLGVRVSDFETGEAGDALRLIEYLAITAPSWDQTTNPFATGHLQLIQRGADAVLRFDRDGAASANGFADLVVFQNVTTAALTARNLGGFTADGIAPGALQVGGTNAGELLFGEGGADQIDALGGDDIVYAGAGADLVLGGDGADQLDGETGNDELHGGADNDVLLESLGGNDQLYGEAGNDQMFVDRQYITSGFGTVLMDGGEGNDLLDGFFNLHEDDVTARGGTGNDHIIVLRGAEVTIDGGDGAELIEIDVAADSYQITLGAGSDILSLLYTGSPVTDFTVLDFTPGNGGDELQMGGFLERVLGEWDPATNPFATGFLLLAQRGDDAVILINREGTGENFALLGTLENVDAAQLTEVNLGFLPGEIAIAGTDGAESLFGTAAPDRILGFGGGDLLDGLGGNDHMAGGLGDDIYVVDSAGDLVIEGESEGFDQVYASVNYALAAEAEIEVLAIIDPTGTAAINLIGNDFGQTIIGNDGDNFLTAGGGADALHGGGGNDTYSVDTQDVVFDASGFDIIYSSSNYQLNAGVAIEILCPSDFALTTPLNLAGNEFGQSIYGNAGDNFLIAGAGADGLYGGLGNDTYSVDTQDIVVDTGGFDIIYSSTNFQLNAGAEIEILSANVFAATTPLNLAGNELGQSIYGNAGDNFLIAGGGADGLYGKGGNDTYSVDSQDVVVENVGEGYDTVYTSTGFTLNSLTEVEVISVNDFAATTAINLTGNEFGQQLIGNAGANILNGGTGADGLVGNGGADTFAFTTALLPTNVDTIVDFVSGTDKTALDHGVFAALGVGALAAGAFVTGSAAGDADDRIVYNSATGQLFYDADGNGAGAAILFATLSDHPAITASDFTII